MEPRGRRRAGAAVRRRHLRRRPGLDLIVSLPTLNWLEFDGGEPAPCVPLAAVLDAAAGAGFDHVGIDDLSVDGLSGDEVARLLLERGLACTDVGVLRLGVDEPAATAQRLAELATATGARTCIAAVVAGGVEEARRDLRAAAEVLDAAGVRIALEHAQYGGLRTLADAVETCAAVGWDRCGLLVDSWHVLRGGGELHGIDAPQVALVHVSDAPPPIGDDVVRESRFRRLPPGRGELDLRRFMRFLDSIGYDGVVSVEVLSADLRRRLPLAAARELRAAVRSISYN